MSFALRCSLICMGRLIYGFNVSVDGYIADAQGNIDWSDPSEELHQYWNDFERETALSLYGRRLYELMSAYWPTADKAPDATPLIVDFARIWRDMPKVVFSRTLESVDWKLPPGTRRPGRGGDEAESRNRRQAGGGRRDAGRTDRAGRTGGRVPARGHAHRRGRRHTVLPDAAVMDLAATVGEPHLSGWHGPAALRGQTRLIAARTSIRDREGTSRVQGCGRIGGSSRLASSAVLP